MSKYTVPKIWGPYFWFVMRCVAHNYSNNPDDNEFNETKKFYSSLQHVLPCNKCKKSYSEHLEKYPLDKALQNRDSIMQWVEIIYSETQKSTDQSPAPPEIIERKQNRAVTSHNSFVKVINKQVTKYITSKNIIPQVKSSKAPLQMSLHKKNKPLIKHEPSITTNVSLPRISRQINTQPNDTKKFATPKKISFDIDSTITNHKFKNDKNITLGPREKKKVTVTKRCNCGK